MPQAAVRCGGVLLLLIVGLAGCGAEQVSPPGDVPRDGVPDGTEGGADGDADADDGVVPDGDADVCTGTELCNDIDDDCDGMTDEDFDFSVDMAHCGSCGAICAPAHAAGACADGMCRVVDCEAGWVDANGVPADGCEYACTATGAEVRGDVTCADGLDNDCDGRTDGGDPDCADCVPELCNRADDDCDGLTDDGFDLDFDPLNCGACGRGCTLRPHGVPLCVMGVCEFDCEPGWSDLDRLAWNGCEASCVPSPDLSESACNGVDDDCDGRTDEDVERTTCGEGVCERLSSCFRGEVRCEPRTPPAMTDTTCDHMDDDCDGETDEDASCTCYEDAHCDDGDACSGVETCIPGVACRPGTPVVCDDGVDCTLDSCNPLDGSCSHPPDGSRCDDANPCNGSETCHPTLGCQPGAPPNCDDGIACTTDGCDPATGSCTHTPYDSACDDRAFCNGPEICDTTRGCRPGTPPNCSDGVVCTDDRCSATTDACVNTPLDSRCDDGQFCNGAERCNPTAGCASGTVPSCNDGMACTADSCDPAGAGGAGACANRPPDADGDGYPPTSCLGTDCNDGDRLVNPGASERCNAVDDDCDGSTDETFACIRGSSGACTVGACSGVRDCSTSCTWGACTVLATELCNGIDDNCNGTTDETFTCRMGATRSCTVTVPTKTCTGTQTCVGPGCTWGGCAIPETGSYIETCNGVDDDCDGVVDDAPTPPLTLCTAAPNATPSCSGGTCYLVCTAGWENVDGTYSNGCECQIETIEGPATCASAYGLGTFADSGADQTITGKITSVSDIDCFSFSATDSTDTACDTYNVDIRFTANPSTQFQMSVYRGGCGTVSCASATDRYSWYTDYISGTMAAKVGECPCRSTAAVYDFNQCTNNGATYAFCVSRIAGFPVTCAAYSIRVTNGVF